MEAFFIVLVVVILLIRGLSKLGGATESDAPRPRAPKKVLMPSKGKKGGVGASHTSPGASAKPGPSKIRRPIFGRRQVKTPAAAPHAPQGPGSETYVHYLIDVLRVGEPAASRQAVDRLVEMGRPALPALQDASRDPSSFVRERAQQATRRILEKLVLAGDPSAAPPESAAEMPPPREPTPLAPPPRRPPLYERRPVPEMPPERVEEEVEEAGPQPAPVEQEAEAPSEPAVALDPGDVEALAAILREAAAEPGFGGRRDEILAPLADAIVKFTVVVDRVQWTGTLGVSPDYHGGRTVGGRMLEADVPIAVSLPKKRNAWADVVKDGATFAFLGVYVSWDGMYDRGKFEGDLLEEPE